MNRKYLLAALGTDPEKQVIKIQIISYLSLLLNMIMLIAILAMMIEG